MATTPNNGLPLIDSSMTADVPRDYNALSSAVDTLMGDMSKVPTTAKNAAGAITELFQSVSNGKTQVAAAITDKGVATSSTDTFATMAANIESIKVGVDTSDATASATDLLSGKTAYVKGQKVTGAISVLGSLSQQIPWVNGNQDTAVAVTMPKGYSDGTIILETVEPNLVSGNIKAGTSIFNVPGKASVVDTADATVTAAHILANDTAYVNGDKVTGKMANRTFAATGDTGYTAPSSIKPDGQGNLSIAPVSGYYDSNTNSSGFGSILVNDPNFTTANIRSGVNIFGLVGTLVPGKAYTTGTVRSSDQSTSFYADLNNSLNVNSSFSAPFVTVSGLNFPNGIRAIRIVQKSGSGSSTIVYITDWFADELKYLNGNSYHTSMNVIGLSGASPGTAGVLISSTGGFSYPTVTSSGFSVIPVSLPGFTCTYEVWGN